jgi:thymidylate synthase
MYQRSCDFALGLPYNISSYSLLNILMSKTCGLNPGKLYMSFGDLHIYDEHKKYATKIINS